MRGNITRRGKSSWQLKFDVGTVNGKRQTRYATVGGIYKDAQRQLTRLVSSAIRARFPIPRIFLCARMFMLGLTPHTSSHPRSSRFQDEARIG